MYYYQYFIILAVFISLFLFYVKAKENENLLDFKPESKPEAPSADNKQYEYYLHYDSETRELSVNNIFILATFNNESRNNKFISYMYERRDEEVLISDLEKDLFNNVEFSVVKILDSIGLKAKARQLFFEYGKHSVTLKSIAKNNEKINIIVK